MKQTILYVGLDVDDMRYHDLVFRKHPGTVMDFQCPRQGLRAVDDAAYVKFAVKDLAATLRLRSRFLAKTMQVEEGSSGHVHLSLCKEGSYAWSCSRTKGNNC